MQEHLSEATDCPLEQELQYVAPSFEYLPDSHWLQAPLFNLYPHLHLVHFPSTEQLTQLETEQDFAVQAVAQVDEACVPMGQGGQVVAAMFGMYVSMPQQVQLLAPLPEYLPAGQGVLF